MGLRNRGRALGRSSLLLISPKLLTPSGILRFSTNSFWMISLLALLVELILSFLIGTLAWIIKITKAVPFESVEVYRQNPFLVLYVSLSPPMISQLLYLLPSAAFFTLTIWPFGPPPLGFHCGGGHTRSSVSIGSSNENVATVGTTTTYQRLKNYYSQTFCLVFSIGSNVGNDT